MKKIIMSSLVTIVVMGVVLICLMFRFGLITAEADVETYRYETYCNGNLIDRHYENEVRGTNLNVDISKKVYIGR